MADVRLTTPRLRVILGDDTAVEVQVINADLVRFDMTRNQHRWPDAESAPMLWLTFVSWVALKRTHTIPEATTWEAYRDSTQQVENLTDDEGSADADVVDPTQLAAEPG